MLNRSERLEDLSKTMVNAKNSMNSDSDHVTHILFIVENTFERSEQLSTPQVLVTYSTVDKAAALIDPESKFLLFPNVIIVSAQLENYTDKYLVLLKQFALQKGIPFLLYSEKFNSVAKTIATEFEFDDYYTGSISDADALIRKIDFIKKLKEYKVQRSTRRNQSKNSNGQTQIKLWTLKRAFDIVVSASILLLISPVLLLIALIIKLESKGPVFYISKRAGNGYKIFDFYKFRSMRQGADSELQKLTHLNQYGDAVFFKIKNDPRITRFGSFLRNTSLDELPQLINVLKGDMSLVGNRPLPLYEAEKLTKDQIAWRFLAPAGITGLWQITKRGKENMSEEERIKLDMQYAMNSSFLYDLKILINTIPALLQKEQV